MPRGVPVSFTKDELIGQTCQAQLEGRPLLKETVDNSIKETIELMVEASIFIRFFQIFKVSSLICKKLIVYWYKHIVEALLSLSNAYSI